MSDALASPLLTLKNLSIGFQKDPQNRKAVSELNLTIERGKCTAIVGESGSGKTLTALSILQLLPQDALVEGAIIFRENDQEIYLNQCNEKEMQSIRGSRISMIFQEPMSALNPLMTCGNQVAEMLMAHQKLKKKAAKEKTISLFAATELPNPALIFDKYPHQISGGQKQRVMIAMAVACNPALLIADEPTTALDASVQKSILKLLKKFQLQYGLSILFITHDLSIISKFADEVVVMYQGVCIEKGKATEVLNKPQHTYTKALLACRPNSENKGKVLPTIHDFLYREGLQIITDAINKSEVIQNENKISIKNTAPVLQVKNLTVRYPVRKNFWQKTTAYQKAIDDISFEVFPGEILGIMGESGSGKTTIGKILTGLIQPDSGQILLQEESIHATALGHQPIQLVFQDPFNALNPKIKIGEAIIEPMQVWKKPANKKQQQEKTIELLRQVGLNPDHQHRYPHEFSGGQRQRICIARALAMEPRFLIFDESVSALDVSIQAQILNLINELKKTYHFTSIFISHDLNVIHYISDRILVMQNGKIVEQGKTADIFQHPQHSYTKELLSAFEV